MRATADLGSMGGSPQLMGRHVGVPPVHEPEQKELLVKDAFPVKGYWQKLQEVDLFMYVCMYIHSIFLDIFTIFTLNKVCDIWNGPFS